MKKNTSGFTIIESLVAVLLLGVVTMAATGLFNYYYVSSSKKSRALSVAFEMEGAILSSVQDINFMRPMAAGLLAGTPPSQFEIKDSQGMILAKKGTSLRFTDMKKNCLPNETCHLQTAIDIKCFPATPYPDCRLAYQIQFLSPQEQVQTQNLGAASLPFKDEDYYVILAYDIFSQDKTNNCNDDGSKYLLTGFNKNTGSLLCASTPTTSCPPGQLPIGMSFVPHPAGGGSLQMKCVGTKKVSCPTNYVLNSFTPQSMDSRVASPNPECVFPTVDQTPWEAPLTGAPPIPSTSVCTKYYNTSTPSCSVSWQDSPVTCGTCSCNCRGGECSGSPPVCTPVTCDTCGGEGTLYPVHGTCNPVGSGQSASATVSIPAQPSCRCGGSPSTIPTSVTLNGVCNLTEPKKVTGTVQ